MNADDYKIEADKYLDLALTCRNGYEHLTNADVIALAQVNATLHLANQQRVANLIAITNSAPDYAPYIAADRDSAKHHVQMVTNDRRFRARLRDEVLKGLGL